MTNYTSHPASYKDPGGFIFESNGRLFRQVNRICQVDYDRLIDSGLYSFLVRNKWLIPHTEVDQNLTALPDWYKTLQPEPVWPITYPYEWCFDQLKDAALLTLSVLKNALEYGMILKDATAFNVQFQKGKPILIDTLSFEQYDPALPWIAYRQFCECFLFPLYLQHYLKTDTPKWLSIYINGIPVEVAAKLLPWRSRFNLGVRLHVLLQRSVKAKSDPQKRVPAFSKNRLLSIITHLQSIITKLSSNDGQTTWSNYYDETILGQSYLEEKENVFRGFINEANFSTALDMGANDGYFSKILAEKATQVIATDADPACIGRLYRHTRQDNIANILPLVVNTTNSTPAVGFNNTERSAFHERIHCDLVAALALVHHLAISENIPLPSLAKYFHSFAPQLIIEFVPKTDPKAEQLLSHRKDIFANYSAEAFEYAFTQYFSVEKKKIITGTGRILYWMKRK